MSVVEHVFPNNFEWGAVLDAHQTEGNDFNSDWWRWEQRPGRIVDNSTSEVASDHYSHYKDDINLAAQLGLKNLIYIPSWARIHPHPDEFDEEALQHYLDVVSHLQRKGIDTTVVFFSAAAPQWFTKQGGWSQPEAPSIFARYVARLTECLFPYCSRYIPLLEPEHWLTMSCRESLWPGGRGYRKMNVLRMQLAQAHLAAHTAIRALQPDAQIGLSLRGMECVPEYPHSAWDQRIAEQETRRYLQAFPAALAQLNDSDDLYDFVLLQPCGRQRVRSAPWSFLQGGLRAVNHQGKRQRYDLPVYPQEGFMNCLKTVHAMNKPIYLMGGSYLPQESEARCGAFCNTLQWMLEGVEQEYPLQGYFHTGLLDGFEWTDGYSKRCGLVHVDRESMTRTPTPLAFLIKDVIKHHTLRPHIVMQCCPEWHPAEEESE